MRRSFPQKLPKKIAIPRLRVIFVKLRQYLWIGLVAIGLAGTGTFLQSQAFQITTILCTYNQRPCPSAIDAELTQLNGSNILTFRPQELENKIHKADIGASKITVTSKLPHTVLVTINGRTPLITMASATNSAQLIIDEQLVPFSIEATPSSYPKIISSHVADALLGQPLSDPLLKSAVILASTFNEYFVTYDSILAQDYHLTVLLGNGTYAIFPMDGNFPALVTSLQLILRESTIQPPLREVDLRYSKPVIR